VRPQQGADFLRIRLKVHYLVWWRLLKPVRYKLEMARADGSHDPISFVPPPDVSTGVWFPPWNNDL
jgi:hypothetical protein